MSLPNEQQASPAARDKENLPVASAMKGRVPTKDKAWMAMYEQLAEHKRLVGHCHLTKVETRSYTPLRKLANWIARQRKVQDTMPTHRKQLLDDLGFYWNPNDYTWFQTYDRVKSIYNQVGHCDIPHKREAITDQNRVYEPYMQWASEQRKQYLLRKGGYHLNMSDRRLNTLQSLGFALELEDKEGQKAVQARADSAVFRRKWRLIPNPYWLEVIAAIKKEKAHFATTGEVRPVVVGRNNLIQVSNDGTLRLISFYSYDEMTVEERNQAYLTGNGHTRIVPDES